MGQVLFDTGSEVSLISHSLAYNLNTQPILKPMNVTGIGSLDVHCTYITSVELYPVDGQKLKYMSVSCYVIDQSLHVNPCTDLSGLKKDPPFRRLKHLADTCAGETSNVDLLLGL